MKFYRFILLSAALLFSSLSWAKVVHVSEAQRVADAFFGSGVRTKGPVAPLSLRYDSNSMLPTRASGDEAPTFYVFAADDGKGFVIVSGDDAVSPVLGYSFEYPAPASDRLPENLAAWFRSVDKKIRRMRSEGAVAEPVVAQQWTGPTADDGEFVMETAKWNQGTPYNGQCPRDGQFICVTGCTSTATAIIMKYHEWPERGIGTTEAYTTMTDKVEVPARDLNNVYDWDNMLMRYEQGKYSEAQANAVATLMADIGHAYKADYGAFATGAWHDPVILYRHFSISPEVRDVLGDYYSAEHWAEIVRSELTEAGPLLYVAYDLDLGGHAFVLDGYNDRGYFHVNWGWGGYCDGFFMLEALAVDEYKFEYNHIAVFDLVPDRGQGIENHLRLYEPGMFTDADVFSPNVPFSVSAYPFNTSAVPFSGKMRLAVTGRDGVVKEWVSDELEYDGLPPRNYIMYNNIRCMFTLEPVIGDRISMFYLSEGTDEWKLMLPNGSKFAGEIFIADEFTIEESASVNFSRETGVLTVGFKNGVAATVLVDGVPAVSGVTAVEGGISVDTVQLGCESFVVHLEKGAERKDISFTVKPL